MAVNYQYQQSFIIKRRSSSGISAFIAKLFVTSIIASIVGSALAYLNPPPPLPLLNPIYAAENLPLPPPTPNQILTKIITQQLENQPGNYAVVVEALNGDRSHFVSINGDQSFPSASLYKLFLMAAAYRQIQAGNLSLDQTISAQADHLAEVAGGVEYGYEDLSGETLTYDVDTILERIARLSDNYCALMLAEKIGWDAVRAEAKEIGAINTVIQSPISTTAHDIALFWRKLYFSEVVDRESSISLLNYLLASQINNRIPDQLPKGLKIAHKTGELAQLRHDSGIVFMDNSPYLIVLLSDDLKGEDDGIQLLSDISKIVFDHFQSNKTN